MPQCKAVIIWRVASVTGLMLVGSQTNSLTKAVEGPMLLGMLYRPEPRTFSPVRAKEPETPGPMLTKPRTIIS